jgi:hypothetical protein
MRPQFRFLIYYGRDDKRVNLDERESVWFFEDAEKVVSGDASVWGSPVVVDGVLLLPDVECLVPPWLRREFFARTSDLGLPEGQHYVYPGVRGPLLLPSDYICKYSSIYIYIYSLFIKLQFCVCGCVQDWDFMLQLWLQCCLTSGLMLCGWAGMF